MLNTHTHKFKILVLALLVFSVVNIPLQSHALVAVVGRALFTILGKAASSKMAIRFTGAVVGGVAGQAGWMVYRDHQSYLSYGEDNVGVNEPASDSNPDSESTTVGADTIYELDPATGNYVEYYLDTVGEASSFYTSGEIDPGTIVKATDDPAYLKYVRTTTNFAYDSSTYGHCRTYSRCTYWIYKISNVPDTPPDVSSTAIPSSTIGDSLPETDSDADILPIILDLSKSLSENVRDIREQLLGAGIPETVVEQVDENVVGEIVSDIPPALRDTMPNTVIEQEIIESNTETLPNEQASAVPLTEAGNVPVEIAEPDIEIPAIPTFQAPTAPIFDNTFELPENKDFLAPVKNFFENVFDSIPFVSVLNTANIETSGATSQVDFDYKGHQFGFDFADHASTYSFMSSVIIFCASILFVIILVL